MPLNADVEILQAALIGLQHMLSQMEGKIQELRQKLGSAAAPASGGEGTASRKRNLSPEARERIAAAQRKRWAAFQESKQTRRPRKKAAKKAAAVKKASRRRAAAKKAVVEKPAVKRAAVKKFAVKKRSAAKKAPAVKKAPEPVRQPEPAAS